jgi:hypothetical protein
VKHRRTKRYAAYFALIILCVTTFVVQLAKATPPFGGTIFLDPDVIT